MSRADLIHFLAGLSVGLVILAVFAFGLLLRRDRRIDIDIEPTEFFDARVDERARAWGRPPHG